MENHCFQRFDPRDMLWSRYEVPKEWVEPFRRKTAFHGFNRAAIIHAERGDFFTYVTGRSGFVYEVVRYGTERISATTNVTEQCGSVEPLHKNPSADIILIPYTSLVSPTPPFSPPIITPSLSHHVTNGKFRGPGRKQLHPNLPGSVHQLVCGSGKFQPLPLNCDCCP